MDTFNDFQTFVSQTIMGDGTDRGNNDGEKQSARLLYNLIDNFDEPRDRDQSLGSIDAVTERTGTEMYRILATPLIHQAPEVIN